MVRPPLHRNSLTNIKFLCSYGGKILPRYPDGKLRYLGGETRVLAVHRSISFSELLLKLRELCGTLSSVILRCQLPKEDLDALVSITSDEDLTHLIEEYDQAASLKMKIRAFLSFPKNTSSPSSSLNLTKFSIPRFSITNPIPMRVVHHYLDNYSSHSAYNNVHGKSNQMFIHNVDHWDL